MCRSDTIRVQLGSGRVEQNIDIVVSAGPDLGARVSLEATAVVIGRGRDADLQLTDLTVSRRHLRVERAAGKISISVIGEAAPFTATGRAVSKATVALGEKFVVGNTALTAVLRKQEVSAASGMTETCEVTSVRSLLSDVAVDARGLSAIFELTEGLDATQSEAALTHTVQGWAQKHVRAESATIRSVDDLPSDDMMERVAVETGTTELTVPLLGVPNAALLFLIPSRALGSGVSNDLRRLLAVAARVVASSLSRLRTLHRVTEQVGEMRRLAVGSAVSFLGSTPDAQRIGKLMDRLAQSEAIALIVGETGAGKSFLARLIHEAGPRADEAFRVINCAAIPDNLVEAELFGHEKGAFTGAAGMRQGAFEAAGRGTVLLDEIGDLPLNSQAKLLRVLEEKQFERIGSNRTQTLNARVLAATNRDLKQMTADGTFRSDLFFRISVVSVPVPALRERKADIAMLAEHFLADLAPSAGRRVTGFSAATISCLERYRWPGNVRELRNVIEHAIVLGDGPVIEPSDLPADVAGRDEQVDSSGGGGDSVQLPLDLATLELRAIEAALRHTGGNRTRAAAILGINRVTLYKKLRALEPDQASTGSDELTNGES